jgi:hypothetical protein
MKSRCNIVDITSCLLPEYISVSNIELIFKKMSKYFRILKKCQDTSEFSNNVKILQNSQKLSKYFRILKKNVKILQNSQKMSKYFRILKKCQNTSEFSKDFYLIIYYTLSYFYYFFLRIIKMADKLQVSPEDKEIFSYHISSVKITHLLIHI